MNKLHVDSVRKSYQGRVILSDIFLSCNRGEVVGLIGRNGSGKSTLLKIIFGIENAENRYVRVNQQVLKSFEDSKKLINYLPQDNFLPNNVRIRNLIKLFLPKKQREIIVENEFIIPLLDKSFQILSGGEKRILEILLLIHSRADFLLLDEPFNGVSPIIRDQIIQKINEEKSEKGFIITDHDYKNVMKVADKILFLESASLREIKDKKDLVKYGYLSPTAYNML